MINPVISVAVMAHPEREKWIPELLDSIDAEATVVWDRRNDRWDTGRRSLLAYNHGATHHLVVQDDAIVCRDLVAGMRNIAEISGDRPVAAYMGRNHFYQRDYYQAMRQRSSFISGGGPWWGVAIMIPTADIHSVVAFGDFRLDVENYDKKIGRYYAQQGIKCWYTVPSLVEHRHGDNPSLIPDRTGTRRRAWKFHGVANSALDITWSGGITVASEKRRGRSGPSSDNTRE